jgi:uncharacterized DUF497 family protein
MDFEWDETKRETVLRDRGIDFLLLAQSIFDGRPVMTIPSPRPGEDRFVTIGAVNGLMFALVWTQREGAVRLITARRARDAEKFKYSSLFS